MDYKQELEDYYIKWEKALENGVFDEDKPKTINEVKKSDLSQPIQPTSVGQDSLVTDDALEATYTPEDIQKLSDMKVQLHELGDKIAEMKDDPKLMKKMKDIQKKIEELSNAMNVIDKK